MIKILLLAVVPFMTQHRNVVPKTEVSTNFYGSVTGIVDKAYIEARVGIGGCDTNAVDALANAAVVTNALTVATTNRVAALETATNNLSSSVSGLASSKADKPALPVTDGNLAALTADGNLSDSGKRVGELAIVTNPVPFILSINSSLISYFSIQDAYAYKLFNIGPAGDFVFGGYNMVLSSGNASKIHYRAAGDDETDANEIAVKGDISATNTTFSDAVLAVNLDFTTNTTGAAYVAVTNALAGFGFDAEALAELPGGKVYGSIGALLAALAAAAAWLKKNKVQTLKLNDGSVATSADGGVAKLDDFFTNSNSLLTGTIDARLPYPLYAVPSAGLLKDRAINTTSLASVTVPDNFTDLLIRASVASSLSVTMPEATTKYGDTFPGEAGEHLITITKTGAAEAYVRTIKLEEVA